MAQRQEEESVRQARLARELSTTLCAATGCGWYHGTWPTLRALGLVASPQRHEAFFTSEIGRSAAAGERSVLVSGAADAAMLELVLDAYRSRRVEPSVTVLDRCATPVRVSADFAARAGTAVTECVTDIFTVGGNGTFEVACTHGLFPLVPPERREDLARRWAGLLRPGGRLVTTSSLSGAEASDPVRFEPDAVGAFVARAHDAAAQLGDPEAIGDPDAVAAAARTWAERATVHPVRSVDEIIGPLERAGFAVALEVREVEGSLAASASGPWTARSSRYAEVVATREAP